MRHHNKTNCLEIWKQIAEETSKDFIFSAHIFYTFSDYPRNWNLQTYLINVQIYFSTVVLSENVRTIEQFISI